jgi:hypothetical protein
MSDESGVTPTDAVVNTATLGVTPRACKGALGTWMVLVGFRALNRVTRTIKAGRFLQVNYGRAGWICVTI